MTTPLRIENAPHKKFLWQKQLDGFQETIQAWGEYQIRFYADFFTMNTHQDFSLHTFQEIYRKNNSYIINGSLTKTTFNHIQQQLTTILAWQNTQLGASEKTAAHQAYIYWEIIKNAIHMPPSECFIYTENVNIGNFFDPEPIASFIFILINKNHGLVISGEIRDQ